MFCSSGPNLVILAWTGDKLSRGQASDCRTHRQTDGGNDNTRRPKLASGKKRHTVWNNSYLQYWKRRLLKQRLLVYLHRCASRCARVWLWRHVCSLRGSSWWMWPLFEICILLLQWIIDTGIYVHGTENNILRLNFHNAFHNVSLIILLLDYKELEFAWCVFKK